MSENHASATVLYSISRKVCNLNPAAVSNRNYYPPAGKPYGSARKGGLHQMKTSRAMLAADAVLSGKVSALFSENGSVYMEYEGQSWYIQSIADGTVFNGPIPSGFTGMLILALLSIVTDADGDFAETKQVFEMIADQYAADGIVELELLAYLCDAYYEDSKHKWTSSHNYIKNELPDHLRREIQQSIRTGHLKLASDPAIGIHPKIAEKIMSTFTHITYDPAIASVAPAPTANSFFEKCKSGEFEVPHSWTAEQAKKIRSCDFLEDFIPNNAHKKITQLANMTLECVVDRMYAGFTGINAIRDDYLNVIITGKPGTGKTVTAEALSATLGLPIYTVTVSKGTEEDEFQGKTKVVKGGLDFKTTPFLEGYENGGIIVLEEFNLADPAVMQGALGQAIEYPFILYKDGYEEVRRHPLCIVISTMNPTTQGAREPNEAFTSRSPITIVMDDPKEDEFIEILHKKGYNLTNCKTVYKCYSLITSYLKEEAGSEELAMAVTLRHCLGTLKLIKAGFDFNESVRDTMIGAIAIRDPALAEEVYQNCVEAKRYRIVAE